MSDQALMEELARRNPQALERLYDRYARTVYSLVLRITRQPATAEEIVQEIFLQLWRNSRAYQSSRGPVEPWLLTLARNRALDSVRTKAEKQRRQEETGVEFPVSASGTNPEFRMDQQRRAEAVRNLISTLPAAQRRAIEMAYFEEMTQSEIAQRLGEPLGTVKTWIRNGLLRLRQELEVER